MRKAKGTAQLLAAVDSAQSADEKLKIFKKVESRLGESYEMGLYLWKIAQQFHIEKQNPLEVISFAKRALNMFLKTDENGYNTSLELDIHQSSGGIAGILILLGSACFELDRYDECLSYLNWAQRNLTTLCLGNNKEGEKYVSDMLRNVHFELTRVKRVMGKNDEVLFHFKKLLDIKEKTMKKDCIELGDTNKDVSDAYLTLGNYKEALPFALKALEIFKKHVGDDSQEIVMLRKILASIYSGLGEYREAFEQNRLCLSGLKSMGNNDLPLLMEELTRCEILVDLGKYEEAIESLKPVIKQSEDAGNQGVRAAAFMVMAKTFCRLEKFVDSRKYIKIALRTIEKQGLGPDSIATGSMQMAKLYVEMKEYEAAIWLVQKALNIPELREDHFADFSLRLFLLVSLSGTEKKRLSSLIEVVERLKEKFGPEHLHLGYGYEKLGIVYMNLGRPEMAAENFVRAKDIFNVSLGPQHLDSLRACQALSIAAGMISHDIAFENLEKVTHAFKGLGLSEQDGANNAVHILNRIKERDGENDAVHILNRIKERDGENDAVHILNRIKERYS